MLKKMYDNDGVTVRADFAVANILLGATDAGVDYSDWDALIIEQRGYIHNVYTTLQIQPAIAWSLGTNTTLDPLGGSAKADGFYISHVDDLKTYISIIENRIRQQLDPNYALTVWSFPVGSILPRWNAQGVENPPPWTDVRLATILEEVQAATARMLTYTSGGVVLAPTTARVTLAGSLTVLGD